MTDHAAALALDWARLGPSLALSKLGLKFRMAGREAFICCPWHGEKNASCTVAIGQSGTLRIHCFACDQTWDIHSLVGQLQGLDPRSAFRDLLRAEAELLGRWDIVDELEGKAEPRPAPRPAPAPPPPAEPERTYPDAVQVSDLLAACGLTGNDRQVAEWLRTRDLDADQVDVLGLAYALPRASQSLPPWARFRGRSWTETGHRLIVPLHDHLGTVRSVRAGRVGYGDSPKRLPPAGHKVSGLVMANAMALELLRAGAWPDFAQDHSLVITEGEPDWMTACIRWPAPAHLGIYSGAWTTDIARRIPDGTNVAIWTDPDATGEKYAWAVASTLSSRCHVIRGGE